MRKILVLFLFAAVAAAQMPPRAQLLKAKYVEDSIKPDFKTYTESELRAAIKIVSARSYAVFGYNTPEVRILMPKLANSSYASIEFSDPALVDSSGKPVAMDIEHGVYDDRRYADEIRFNPTEGDQLVQFARVSGTVKVKYPLSVTTQTFTPLKPGPKELGVKINGPYVSFDDEAFHLPDSSFDKLPPVRAFDASGRQLQAHGYSESGTDRDGVYRKKMAFYGTVARLEIDSVDSWAEFELPYDLTPAPMLPTGHEGEDPDSYK